MTDAQQILLHIATGQDSTYDSEYDGRMYTYCRYCDRDQEHNEQHDSDCAISRARVALGPVWTLYIEQQAAQAAAAATLQQAQAKNKQEASQRVSCDKCGKRVARCGMTEHQRSPACEKKRLLTVLRMHEERSGIKCITDIFINYEGKRCAQCEKPMPTAHTNARFCSNTGSGNCKDKHHNRQPGRISRSREWTAEREVAMPTMQERLAAKCQQEGWDEHKDF